MIKASGERLGVRQVKLGTRTHTASGRAVQASGFGLLTVHPSKVKSVCG
jgi:hypothetical protein